MYWKSKRAAVLDDQGTVTGEIGFLRDIFPNTGWPESPPQTISAPRTPGGDLVSAVWIEDLSYDPVSQKLIPSALYLDGSVAREHTAEDLTDADKLALAVAAKILDLKKLLATKIAAGFAYTVPGGAPHTYQIGEAAQADMTSIAAAFGIGDTNAHGGVWRDASNAMVAMTDDEVKAFFKAARAYGLALRRRYWALKAAIEAAGDQTALDAVDITTGWPS